MHMVTPNAANFVWKTNLGLEGSTQNSANKIAQKTCIFGPKTPLWETVSRTSSGKFLRVESCYPESFGFLCLWNTLGHRWLKLKFQDRCKLQTWKCKEWFTLVSSKLGMEKYFYSWADFLHDMNTKLSHSWQKQLRIWFNKAIKKSEEKGGSKRRPENIRQKLVENLVAVILLPAIAPFANVRIFMVSSCSKVCSLNS